MAAANGHVEVVAQLVGLGADVDAKDVSCVGMGWLIFAGEAGVWEWGGIAGGGAERGGDGKRVEALVGRMCEETACLCVLRSLSIQLVCAA